ncbi:Hint domain-containing protein [Cupriavidus sp. SZY C1]|uniref:Hint domain-containing protein n=1 Tax=Cupriavidus sp. SZY C1 TaxID=3055037 RepID=UPI0028B8B78B|nr:Hint domain-containing protein [Cupriavidus sp. SZY C1]MDT6962821.1 Hint domain-containing protein [Cupriavidus sp. SZY C1]
MAIDLMQYNGVEIQAGNYAYLFSPPVDNGDGTWTLPAQSNDYSADIPREMAGGIERGPITLTITDAGNGTYNFSIDTTYLNGPMAGPQHYLQMTGVRVVATSADAIVLVNNFGEYILLTTDDMYVNEENGLGYMPANTVLDNAGQPAFEPPAPCFAAGTRLATVGGTIAVEALKEGDVVLTAAGQAREVRWIGHSHVNCARHPRPWEVLPIRIKAHAFGDGRPARDLVVSPGHAIYVEGVLIPAGFLLNGATIVQESVQTVDYYHVELDAHDVLLAEDLPCESYLDDGNRNAFANAGQHAALHGRLDPQSWENACAPCVMAGPQLVEVRHMLLDRAIALGYRRETDADLHLTVEGARMQALHGHGQRQWFVVPAGSGEVALASRSGVLAQLFADAQDGRELGVCISEVRVNGQPLPLDGDAFAQGFYPLETQGATPWRWTNGNARLALPASDAPAMIEITTVMQMVSWQAPALHVARMAA